MNRITSFPWDFVLIGKMLGYPVSLKDHWVIERNPPPLQNSIFILWLLSLLIYNSYCMYNKVVLPWAQQYVYPQLLQPRGAYICDDVYSCRSVSHTRWLTIVETHRGLPQWGQMHMLHRFTLYMSINFDQLSWIVAKINIRCVFMWQM